MLSPSVLQKNGFALLLANTLSQKYRSKYGAKMVHAIFAYQNNGECLITM